jgi:molybdopterin synthase catalytic subunit
MTVRVRLFAILRDRAGAAETSLDLPARSTIAQALSPLLDKLPALGPHLPHCNYAVNHAYVPPDTVLHDGDELALIPPVSGG